VWKLIDGLRTLKTVRGKTHKSVEATCNRVLSQLLLFLHRALRSWYVSGYSEGLASLFPSGKYSYHFQSYVADMMTDEVTSPCNLFSDDFVLRAYSIGALREPAEFASASLALKRRYEGAFEKREIENLPDICIQELHEALTGPRSDEVVAQLFTNVLR